MKNNKGTKGGGLKKISLLGWSLIIFNVLWTLIVAYAGFMYFISAGDNTLGVALLLIVASLPSFFLLAFFHLPAKIEIFLYSA